MALKNEAFIGVAVRNVTGFRPLLVFAAAIALLLGACAPSVSEGHGAGASDEQDSSAAQAPRPLPRAVIRHGTHTPVLPNPDAVIHLTTIQSAWSVEVAGVQIDYRLVSEFAPLPDGTRLLPEQMTVPLLVHVDDDGTCLIEVHSAFLAGVIRTASGLSVAGVRYVQARSLADLVTTCLVHGLAPDAQVVRDADGLPELQRPWSAAYINACGSRLQPLGLPTDDGECEVPDLNALLRQS